MNIFGDIKFLLIFLGSSQNWPIFRVISMHFRFFSFFFWLVKFQIFFGLLEIPDIFWGERSYV